MIGSPAAGAVMFLASPSGQVEQGGENQVDQDYEQYRNHHGRSGGAPDLFGSGACGEALLAADGGDDQAEDDTLDDTAGDIAEEQGIARGNHVAAGREAAADHSEKAAAQHAHQVRPDGETGQHHRHRQKFGHYQKRHGIEGHGFQRIQFFRDAHSANLGGERRAGASDHDDGRDQRTQLAGDGDGDEARHQLHGADSLQLVGALQSDDDADKEGDQTDDRYRADTGGRSLMNRAVQHAGALQRRNDEKPQRIAEDHRQAADVGDAPLRHGAYIRDPLHHAASRASCSVAKTRKMRITWVNRKTS